MTTLRQAAQQALEVMEGELPGWRTPAQENSIAALRAALEQPEQPEQPEQEPVAWIESPHGAIRANPLYRMTAAQSLAWSIPLYTTPPRREWQSLSRDESLKLWGARSDGPSNSEMIGFARAIEAALKEKNHE